ncbi:MAG: HesA/MoeB/ThiF family protein [Candidatus Gastranaerophilales bacterium]|nr:HesA/MoeB/ThiF family protein [Candidatus Gastranaerophilales bacterium]
MNFDRYKRNIAIDIIGKNGQLRLLSSKVLVAGSGGLGSSVIANLASVGIGELGIIDFDNIEISNLNRQFIHSYKNCGKPKSISAKEWIQNYNPNIKVNSYNLKLENTTNIDFFDKYDLVIDCFDTFSSKFLLNNFCVQKNKTLIHGGVSEFSGQITVIKPHKTACLSCLFEEKDEEIFQGNLSPIVSVIGSLQALEAVKILLNLNNTLENKILTYNAIENTLRKINISSNLSCKICQN